jgi:hypothetical protein
VDLELTNQHGDGAWDATGGGDSDCPTVDEIVAGITAAGASITPLSPLDATDGGDLDVLERDDYSSTTGQAITFNVEVNEVPHEVWFDVSYKRQNLLHIACVFSETTAGITVEVPQLTAAEIATLPLGALAAFRFYGVFADEPTTGSPERTLRRGVVNVTEVATPPA